MSNKTTVDWNVVVEQIRSGDPSGEETLYRTLNSGVRLFLQRRRLDKAEIEDRLHDVFLIVIETIRQGELREPERLMGFVRTVLTRQVSLNISRMTQRRNTSMDLDTAAEATAPNPSPEEEILYNERVTLMKNALGRMKPNDFEVLARFYLYEQSPEQIQMEMSLTQTQFNLLKSRAKARLASVVERRMTRHPFSRQ